MPFSFLTLTQRHSLYSHHMHYTVHQLAKLAGMSVRTLHYYDEIDLRMSSFINENGDR